MIKKTLTIEFYVPETDPQWAADNGEQAFYDMFIVPAITYHSQLIVKKLGDPNFSDFIQYINGKLQAVENVKVIEHPVIASIKKKIAEYSGGESMKSMSEQFADERFVEILQSILRNA